MSELVSSKHDDVAPRLSFYRRYFSTPQPLYKHLIYLGLALNVCYWFVGYSCVIAVEESTHPDSRSGAFFMVTALPFWTGIVFSFRQFRLLWQYYANVWEWAIVIVSHVLFLYYLPLFLQFWLGLVFGVLGVLFFIHLGVLSGLAFLMSVTGRDPVINYNIEELEATPDATSS